MYIKDRVLIHLDVEDLKTCSDGKGNIILPKYIEEISYDAFVFVKDQVKTISAPDVRKVWSFGFKDLKNLVSVNLPACDRINAQVFTGTKVKKLDLPNLEFAGIGAFSGCSELEEVNLPDTLQLERDAFANCTELKIVRIPNVKRIGKNAFVGCNKLEKVEMPSRKDVVLGGNVFPRKLKSKFLTNDIEMEM